MVAECVIRTLAIFALALCAVMVSRWSTVLAAVLLIGGVGVFLVAEVAAGDGERRLRR